MPTGQQSSSGSIQVVNLVETGYSASVQPMRTKDYTASVYPVIQPDRFVRASVEVRANDGDDIDRDYHGSIYASFTPITPDRFITGSVHVVAPAAFGKNFTASVEVHTLTTILQDYFASIKLTSSVNRSFTGSVVGSILNNELTYRGSVSISTPTTKTYSASIVKKALDLVKAYTASVRPYVAISPAEQVVRDADVNLLIFLVQERDSLIASIASQTARLNNDNLEITRLLNILIDLDDKPSCRLSTVSPSINVPRGGGSVMFVSGFDFIPTCTVTLTQGIVTIGSYTPVVTSSSFMSFTLPNFTTVGGLDLGQPISIRVNNPDGQVSETITFTLASS